MQVEQMEFKLSPDVERKVFELTSDGLEIAEYAVFQQLFYDDGERLYHQVLDAGFVKLARELTRAEADLICGAIRRQHGADK